VAGTALCVCGAIESLAGGLFLHLSVADGLAFWSPWCFWIAAVLGGGQTSRTLHPWIGLVFFVAVMRMYSLWAAQMRSTEADKSGGVRCITMFGTKTIRCSGGAVQRWTKALFWSFFYGAILLLLTGIVLWFPRVFLEHALAKIYRRVSASSGGARDDCEFPDSHLHERFCGTRAFGSVIRGDVSLEFAKRYHPGWYDEIVGGRSSAPRK